MQRLSSEALDQLFLQARTHQKWLDRPVPDALLRELYELAKLTPTATNSHPTRYLFVKSAEARRVLAEALPPSNVEKMLKAPATAVVAWDERYHAQMPKLFPARGEALAAAWATQPTAARDAWVLQNTGLEASALIYAARALGLDAGPMGGFDKAKVDATLLAGTGWHSVLLVNLGYGDAAQLPPRLPRLDFDEAARIA